MKETSQILSVNGLRMHVMTAGEGPAVLLMHGFPDTHLVWRKQVGPLVNAGYRVIVPDMRGYGQTDAPTAVSAYRTRYICDDMLALLDQLGVQKARLVGHDWGALIGWLLCMRAPERFEQYVALSVGHPAAFARAGIMQRLRSSYMLWFMVPFLPEQSLSFNDFHAMRNFTKEPTQYDVWRRNLREPGRLTAALNYYRANVPRMMLPGGKADPVSVPVMGVWSSRDVALTEEQMRDSAQFASAGFRYERIDGADHWLQLTAADRLNALLLDFFAAAPQSKAATAEV